MRRALAVLRILAGAGMMAAGLTKLLDPAFLYGGILHTLGEYGRAYPFYQDWMLNRYVEWNQTLFAYAVGVGELLVGVCLLLGLLVSLASLGGIFLMINFALATSAGNPVALVLHLVSIGVFILLGRAAAGVTWGLDGLLVRRLNEALVLFPFRLSLPSE
jgi:uncharacterized membrane protein YphA (DoxX/SURF4 family)